jgi:hypothetical protein
MLLLREESQRLPGATRRSIGRGRGIPPIPGRATPVRQLTDWRILSGTCRLSGRRAEEPSAQAERCSALHTAVPPVAEEFNQPQVAQHLSGN